ncbi:MAG: TerB family tellurite resistance protein [Pseudomonadota bacterium]
MGIWGRIGEAVEEAHKRTLGSALDAFVEMKARRDESAFSIALIALSAKIARADGFVTDNEVAAFRKFFAFPQSEESKVKMVFDLAKQDVAGFDHYARQVARIFEDDPVVLEDVIDCLLYVALADGQAHPREMDMLENAAAAFKLAPGAWRRIKASHLGQDRDDPYVILDLEHDADTAALREKYRALMRENHPDALIARGVPPGLVKIAENRTAAINAAYEKILAERAR